MTNENDNSRLWHNRFGHLNFKSMMVLCNKNMVHGLPRIEEKHDVCEGCALGNYHRQSYTRGVAWRSNEKLEFVLAGVYDPMRILFCS